MRTFLTGLLILGGFLPFRGVQAQDVKDVPPPKAPFVAPVPENADWVVTAKNPPVTGTAPDGTPLPNKSITSVQSTKVGRFKRDRITTGDGAIEERWFVDMLLLCPTPKGDVAAVDLSSIPPQVEDSNPSIPHGFPGVGWLKPEYYEGVVLLSKRPYYHYVHGSTEAWVDVETKLPLAYKFGNFEFQFKFNAPPTGPLTMPDDYQKALKICDEALAYRKKLMKDLSGGR